MNSKAFNALAVRGFASLFVVPDRGALLVSIHMHVWEYGCRVEGCILIYFFMKKYSMNRTFHDADGGSAAPLSTRLTSIKSLSDAAVSGCASPNSRRRNSHALFKYGLASCNLCIPVMFTTTRSKHQILSFTSEKLWHANKHKHNLRTHVGQTLNQ